MLTRDELLEIMPNAGSRVDQFFEPINAAMEEFDIDTPIRQAMFLAQVAHESGSLHYVKELASGNAYEGRLDLGNSHPGDGQKFKGRGLIQVTGRHWYERARDELGIDCVEHPEYLEDPENACRISAWWWKVNKVNDLADKGNVERVTRKVNGGINGLNERVSFYNKASEVLSVT